MTKDVLDQPQMDAATMTRIVGIPVSRKEFNREEDTSKTLAAGVTWRRRRFRFYTEEQNEEEDTLAGLCINEITIEPGAEGELRPLLAADYPGLVDFAEVENAYWQTNWATGAIRGGRGTKESRLYLNVSALLHAKDAAERRRLVHLLERLDVLTTHDAALADEAAALEPVYAEQPEGNFRIARYLPAFPPSRLVQAYESVLAATNAGYFLNFPEEYDDGISPLHLPMGGHLTDSGLVTPPWLERPGVAGFAGGRVRAGLYGPEHLELAIEGFDPLALHRWEPGGEWNGAIVRHFNVPNEGLPAGAAAVSFMGSVPVRVSESHVPLAPPLGGVAVIVTGDRAQRLLASWEETALEVRLGTMEGGKAEWMICSGPFLVHDGGAVSPAEMLTPRHAGEFFPGGPAPTRFPYDTELTRAPRTAMGVFPSGAMKLVVVDGRRSREHSIGLTLAGMAELMALEGCSDAINLDGGGSSVLAIEGLLPGETLRENLAYGVTNVPSDEGGRERIVPVVLAVRKRR